ncbi:MAG: hypothetical protein ACO38Q_08200 [Aquiluna sp.]
MIITNKCTKAEIWEAYQALLAQSQAETITMPAVRNTAQTVARETIALAEDIAKLGSWAQQRISEIVEIYNRPILKSR